MRILQICNKAPFPPKDGGCIAMNNLTQGLIDEGHTLKVLAITTPKHFVELNDLPADYRAQTNIELVFIDTAIKPVPALLNLFSSESYNIVRFYSKAFEEKIIEVLKQETYDIIQLESLYVSMYTDVIRKHSTAKIVLRAHNVEHKLWERNAATADNLAEKLYYNLLAKRLKKYESGILNFFDAIAAITKEDAQWFTDQKINKPVEVIPFGIDLKKISAEENILPEHPSVFHIGAMDWQPNVEGVKWFLDHAWKEIHKQHPTLKLYLAGRSMSDEFKKLNLPNVIVVGEVENAHLFIRSKGLMLVPLLSGGGMRVKIIEGMALGKTIVTTPVGAEGIECENNKNILIATDAAGFVNAVNAYVGAPDHLNGTGEAAKLLAAQNYNNSDICRRLASFYQNLHTGVTNP
ncbi:MAG: hypothetical protein JWP12_3423 [Bacteroidetes bacterium]|nr:hypothetical protein [Bacteroidota bacterium]